MIPSFNAFALIGKGLKFGGSQTGPPAEIREMLDLAVKKGVKAFIQTRPLTEANTIIQDFTAGKPRYRFVLINEKQGGKM